MYRLKITVDEVKGFCDLPMKVGDSFFLEGGRLLVPMGKHVCIWALQAMMPFLTVKQRKTAEENDWIPTTSKICCPDPNGMVIYRVDTIDEGDEGTEAPSRSTVDEGVPPRLLVDASKCSGCRRCELQCSFAHESRYWPEMSRVRVAKQESQGTDAPMVCRQCGTARCIETCPAGALRKDPQTQAVLLDKGACLRCYACAAACPFGAIHEDIEGFPLICDLCGGEPQCVQSCPTAALSFGRAGDQVAKPRFAQPGKERP